MKTKDFIKKVKEMGFTVCITEDAADVLKDNEEIVVTVGVNKAFMIDCFYFMNMSSEEGIREKVFDLVVEYAKTPVEDRDEEKKFYLRHRLIQTDGCYMYLQKTSDDDKKMSVRVLGFSDNDDIKFSGKEIEEIKEKFDTDLADFKKVEVVDD